MATVQGLTKARTLEIENGLIVSAEFNSEKHLILTKHDDTTIDAGVVPQTASYIFQEVKNNTGATLTKGTAVYISGADGTNVLVSKAKANAESTSSKTLGLIYSDIANGEIGKVITEGLLSNFDTSSAVAGNSVWLSPVVAGGVVYGTPPYAPYHMVYLGVVTRSNANNGEILVKVQNGYELDELHNVFISAPGLNELLVWDSNANMWLNKTPYEAGVATSGDISGLNSAVSAAQSTANTALGVASSAMPISGGTFTGDISSTNIYTNTVHYYIPSPATIVNTATLTQTNLLSDIIISAGTAAHTLTLPTGQNLDAAIFLDSYGWTWSIVNTVAFAKTIAAATGHTYVGNATIAANTSAGFITRKSSANTFVTYRIK